MGQCRDHLLGQAYGATFLVLRRAKSKWLAGAGVQLSLHCQGTKREIDVLSLQSQHLIPADGDVSGNHDGCVEVRRHGTHEGLHFCHRRRDSLW